MPHQREQLLPLHLLEPVEAPPVLLQAERQGELAVRGLPQLLLEQVVEQALGLVKLPQEVAAEALLQLLLDRVEGALQLELLLVDHWDTCLKFAGYKPASFEWRGPRPQKKTVSIPQ